MQSRCECSCAGSTVTSASYLRRLKEPARRRGRPALRVSRPRIAQTDLPAVSTLDEVLNLAQTASFHCPLLPGLLHLLLLAPKPGDPVHGSLDGGFVVGHVFVSFLLNIAICRNPAILTLPYAQSHFM